ncbi:zinc finger: C3HC4 type-like protein, partial [Leptotrombidium deliense]
MNSKMIKVDDVHFCKDYINRKRCWRINCHLESEEVHYKRTGYLSQNLADFWKKSQDYLCDIIDGKQVDGKCLCHDHKHSLCFRPVCYKGAHYNLRDFNTTFMVQIEFVGGSNFQEMYRNSSPLLANKTYYKEVYCHKFTPFGILLKDLQKSLRNVMQLSSMQVSFEGQIVKKNNYPAEFKITDESRVIIEISKSEKPLKVEPKIEPPADICAVCYGDISEPTVLQPCQHTFCFVCIDQWFKIMNINEIHCPLCRSATKEIWKQRFLNIFH